MHLQCGIGIAMSTQDREGSIDEIQEVPICIAYGHSDNVNPPIRGKELYSLRMIDRELGRLIELFINGEC